MSFAHKTVERVSTDDTLALWREYKQSRDPRKRDRLILTFAPMVKYIVYRKLREIPTRCDVEDFISCGLEALIRTIDRYDPAKGATLEQYAWTRIHGAVLDELRRADWAPRSLRRWDRDMNRARDQFQGLYGRPPSEGELSDALGVTVKEFRKRMGEIARAHVGSLNSLVLGEDETSLERIDTLVSNDPNTDPEACAMRDEAKAHFRAAFQRLPVRERKIAVLLYVHGLTLREIGAIVGVTESRVCQIHAQITKKLRAQLEPYQQLFSEVA
ncbi:MAG TPA: FliA/WhiG family RNA polymerase sigma factor [Solirubrobacteraceae bacterium]